MESSDAIESLPSGPGPAPEYRPPEDLGTCLRAKVMFFVSVLFLISLSIVLPHVTVSDRISEALLKVPWFWPWTFVLLWSLILVESLAGVFQAPDGISAGFRRFLLVGLVPPLRMAFSASRPNRDLWFPRAGWLPVNRESAEVMELVMAIPMLVITLAILPVLGVELFLAEQLAQHPGLGIGLHLTTGLIWMAFVLEFILLFGAAEKKLDFCRRHWVNLVIIVLPLVAFLRLLRLTRLARLIRAGKMIRAYRVRGLYMRAMRVAVLFNLVERVLHRKPEDYLRCLQARIEEKERELEGLRRRADQVRAELATLEVVSGEGELRPASLLVDSQAVAEDEARR